MSAIHLSNAWHGGRKHRLLCVLACALVLTVPAHANISQEEAALIKNCLQDYDPAGEYRELEIVYPFDKSVFPPELCPPTVRWRDPGGQSARWLVDIDFGGQEAAIRSLVSKMRWQPSAQEWQAIKGGSSGRWARLTILGLAAGPTGAILSAGRIEMKTSTEPVGAPLMFREVNLPFEEAVRDTTNIVWRFGPLHEGKPPVVLANLPVCGNCHSFSADGKTFGMDVDFGNDKGSYAISPVQQNVELDEDKVMTWSAYTRATSGVSGGMLPSVSPSGRYIAATIQDKSVFLARDDLAFSQLFFPASGLLGIYDRETGEVAPLPGADDPDYVQTNPVWSPDGKELVFARAKAYMSDYTPRKERRYSMILPEEYGQVFLTGERGFKFDLYRIPFNGGKGGTPVSIPGASHNGMSNYFPKFTPDGKWLVFCQAENFMLLMPDSKLWIMPADGGEPRLMECNTNRMNSWHTFSPNGKWMVFSSKVFSDYTQLMLTRIRKDGTSTPPVLLDHLTRADRAANIPEFVNAAPDAIQRIAPAFLDAM